MNYKLNLLKKKLIDKYPQLQKWIRFNYGIDLSLMEEEKKDTHYIFGISTTLIKKILKPDANWLPEAEALEKEKQSGPNIESMNCTVYGFLNCVEIIMKYKYGLTVNYSDRWLGIKSGTTKNGNIPTRVLDTARKQGFLLQELLPNNIDRFSWNEFFSYKGATMSPADLDKEALKWLDIYSLGYEIVYPSIIAMAEALKISPLYVAGAAWADINGIYYSFSNPNHCFAIVNIQQAIAYKKAIDSYEPYIKTLGRNFQVFWPKIIIINKKGQEFNVSKLRELLKRGLEYIQRPQAHGEAYKITPYGLEYKSKEELNDDYIRQLEAQKKLVGVNEEYFNNLLV